MSDNAIAIANSKTAIAIAIVIVIVIVIAIVIAIANAIVIAKTAIVIVIAIVIAIADSPSQRLWLEASTLSNRGEMRQHLPTDNDLHPPLLAGSQYHTEQLVVSNDC